MPHARKKIEGLVVANVLPAEKRLEVLAALVNGNGVRAAERMTGVHRDTIVRFGVMVGEACSRLHDRLVRDLSCALVDLDEQHSWCGVRQQNLDPAKHDPTEVGEQWTWAAICRTSRLIISWHVGKRDQSSADVLVGDVRARLAVMPQITTDGLGLYEAPIAVNFGPAVPYMQTVKNFSQRPSRTPEGEKFSVKRGVDFITKRAVFGAPDPAKATTYAIERNNLTARQWNARMRRRTLSFSKKLAHHRAATALFYVHYNLCHIPRNLRATPAMLAGMVDRVWTVADLLHAALAEPVGQKPEPKPLLIPKPAGSARELPAGRGWLRAIDGGGTPAVPPPSPEAPIAASAAPVAPAPTSAPAVEPAATRPKVTPSPGTQLSLFGPEGGDPLS